MTYATIRPGRNRSIALACAAAIAAAGLTQTGAVASPVTSAATGPSLSHVDITPNQPTKGKGFKVSFKTKAGGTYEVFYSTGQSGDLLVDGPTKTGTITTAKLGKKLRAGKYTLGVRVTKSGKQKTVTKPLVIKK
jgi:hypothetical protein